MKIHWQSRGYDRIKQRNWLSSLTTHAEVINFTVKNLDIFVYFRLGFGHYVKWHINIRGLFNAKAIILKEQ